MAGLFNTITGSDWKAMFKRPVTNSISKQLRIEEAKLIAKWNKEADDDFRKALYNLAKQLMKDNYSEILVILDSSGSMAPTKSDTLGGLNKIIYDQKRVPGMANLTVVHFNDTIRYQMEACPMASVPHLTDADYHPDSGTALLDAIGLSVNRLGARLAGMKEELRPGKVIVVIITDGEENSSTQFNNSQIRDMIKLQQGVYKWEFVFLGANQDAFANGNSYGIKSGNSITYFASSQGIADSYFSLSKNATKFRAGGCSTMGFDVDDLKKQEEAGA